MIHVFIYGWQGRSELLVFSFYRFPPVIRGSWENAQYWPCKTGLYYPNQTWTVYLCIYGHLWSLMVWLWYLWCEGTPYIAPYIVCLMNSSIFFLSEKLVSVFMYLWPFMVWLCMVFMVWKYPVYCPVNGMFIEFQSDLQNPSYRDTGGRGHYKSCRAVWANQRFTPPNF